jgi:hypothetical protein
MRVLSFFAAVSLVTAPAASLATAPAAKNFEFFGVNESGPEFGEGVIPGIKGKHVRNDFDYLGPRLTSFCSTYGQHWLQSTWVLLIT